MPQDETKPTTETSAAALSEGEEQAVVADAIQDYNGSTILGDPMSVSLALGSLGWVVAMLAAAVAFHRSGAGWPVTLLVGFAAVFAACVFMAPRGPPSLLWWQRIALAVVILGGVVAIELSQYLSFNPVRSAFVLGVQGRYFTPFAAVAAFALSNSLLNRPSFELFCKLVCSLFVVSAHTCAFLILARAAGKV